MKPWCRYEERFNVYWLFDLLSWLHSEMTATQRLLQRQQEQTQESAAVVVRGAQPRTAHGAAVPAAASMRQLSKHLYHCSAFAERTVGAVVGCLQAVEAREEQRKQGGTVDCASASSTQELLQSAAALLVRPQSRQALCAWCFSRLVLCCSILEAQDVLS
jgi:hypothetical protein